MADENVGLTGQLFAKASGVTNAAANEIAEFRAGWTVALEETFAEWYGQSIARKQAVLTQLDIAISIPEVAFKPNVYDTAQAFGLFDITVGAVAIKSVGAEAATSYNFTATAGAPKEMEYLVQCILDGKTYQAWAPSAKIMTHTINFTNQDFVVMNIDLILYGATGDLLTLIHET